MKYNILFFCLFLTVSMVVTSCVDDDDVTIDYGTENSVERGDPLLLINTPVISFVAGEPSYEVDLLAYIPTGNGTTKVEIYSTFTDAGTGEVSNEGLLKSYDVSTGENPITETLTYADLKAGLTVGGQPLPDNEVDIPVGSKWDLTVKPVDGSGVKTFNSSSIVIGVLSPFAGLYKVIESDYWRISVQSGGADWSGTEIFIGSINATTFSHNDYVGPFAAEGLFEFVLNDDNSITVPDTPDQLSFFTGSEMLTCQDDDAMFVNVPCTGSNVLIPANDGKHIIKLTYGYFTASGDENEGAREFYEVLEKIVE